MIKIYAGTDRGLSRSSNEDRIVFHVLDRNLGYAAIADGMGGVEGGALASTIATDEIRHQLDGHLDNSLDERSLSLLADTAFANANWKIYKRAHEEEALAKMGTTLSLLILTPKLASLTHIGDSRCYLFREQKLEQLSRDHTLANHLEDLGEVPSDCPDASHQLMKVLGVDKVANPDYYSFETRPNDVLLLCSDGLYNSLSSSILISRLQEAIEQNNVAPLIDSAIDSGGPDNISAIIVEIH